MMKRVIDVAAAAIILVLLSPVLAAVAVAVWVNLGFPILFRQQRPGLNGEPFTLYKFRTMSRANVPEPSCALDEVRLTRFGRWLRRTSLDELPELWNVLRGDMSLVGPRPLLMRYLALYTEEQMRRHEVRPGLTGWAQVNGRNAVDWEEKFELDLWYVDNSSLLLDTKILLLTVRALLKRQGISHQNSATMPEFRGSSRSQIDRKEPGRHKSLD
jgi:lipopolysaccharide/colanic/teichoic acid biosynthesis glycosyltransferase